jgi:uncharacterized protein YqjF (DUF2071 family)
MYQSWTHLLFLHWAWDPAEIQKTLPPGLTVDLHEGKAWLGIVPFFMRNIRPRFLPTVPWLSNFLELNVRTYVHDENGRPGVWFYSLDCNQPLAVWTARTFFHLPYQHARMAAPITTPSSVAYSKHRRGAPSASNFHYHLETDGNPPTFAEPGTLEFFLLERYYLFASTPRGIRSGQVHHTPYPMVPVRVDAWDTRVLALNGFEEPNRPPDHISGSTGVDVLIFPLV